MSLRESLKSALGAFLNAFGISRPEDVAKKPEWRVRADAEAAEGKSEAEKPAP